MLSLCVREASHDCISSCLSNTFIDPDKQKNHPASTTSASCLDFSMPTVSLLPSIHFTNHESLPSLSDALANFNGVYPKYVESEEADRFRDSEYCHLSNLTCLDYTGIGLFSHAQFHSSIDHSYPPTRPSSSLSQPTFFSITYKPANLKSQVRYGYQETALESAIRRRIMGFLNISDDEYSMVYIGSRASAFKVLAESYPFHSNKRLLTVYDHENEAVSKMVESAQKRGVRFMPASFSWPSLRIQSAKLKKMIMKREKNKKKGLFVFPLQSQLTGARYHYKWMSLAQKNGWHVVLDACTIGPKDMDALGLSLIKPDFIVCSFFKIFGENPSGFSGLFIKRSSSAILEASATTKSNGVVSIIPARCPSKLFQNTSSTELEVRHSINAEITSSSHGQIPAKISDDSDHSFNRLGENNFCLKGKQIERHEKAGTSERREVMVTQLDEKVKLSEILHLSSNTARNAGELNKTTEIECRGLDHADSMGLRLISNRLRCITDWLVNALMKLQHPHSENAHPLVKIYGPRRKFDRGTTLAFNVFDWKGEKIEPTLVQKLADRNNISLSCGFLQNISFPDKFEDKHVITERRVCKITTASDRMKEKIEWGITVVNASFGFLNNFEDAYRLWAFVAKFLDADFVEKEKWRYMALDQKLIEV